MAAGVGALLGMGNAEASWDELPCVRRLVLGAWGNVGYPSRRGVAFYTGEGYLKLARLLGWGTIVLGRA